MDNAQKAIMIGVGLFITIIVISAVMLITGVAQDLLNQGQSQLGNLSGNLQNQLLNQYDQKTMSGSVVLSAIKDYYNNEELVVLLYNKGNEVIITPNLLTGGTYTISGAGSSKKNATDVIAKGATGLGENTAQPNLTTFSDKNNENYIKPTSQYKAVLVQTEENKAIVGVAFIKYK